MNQNLHVPLRKVSKIMKRIIVCLQLLSVLSAAVIYIKFCKNKNNIFLAVYTIDKAVFGFSHQHSLSTYLPVLFFFNDSQGNLS